MTLRRRLNDSRNSCQHTPPPRQLLPQPSPQIPPPRLHPRSAHERPSGKASPSPLYHQLATVEHRRMRRSGSEMDWSSVGKRGSRVAGERRRCILRRSSLALRWPLHLMPHLARNLKANKAALLVHRLHTRLHQPSLRQQASNHRGNSNSSSPVASHRSNTSPLHRHPPSLRILLLPLRHLRSRLVHRSRSHARSSLHPHQQ
jgi:hypothetical protein